MTAPIPVDHPLSLGLVQRGGTYQANHACIGMFGDTTDLGSPGFI